jgi:hypothetical protein
MEHLKGRLILSGRHVTKAEGGARKQENVQQDDSPMKHSQCPWQKVVAVDDACIAALEGIGASRTVWRA